MDPITTSNAVIQCTPQHCDTVQPYTPVYGEARCITRTEIELQW